MTERLTEKITNRETGEVLLYRLKGQWGEIGDNRMRATKKLGELEDAEEDGRLVVLPCKVGDTVYLILNTDDFVNPIISCKVRQIIIRDYGTLLSLFSTDEMIGHTDWYPIEDIGVKIFLTREESEKALKEMEGKQ